MAHILSYGQACPQRSLLKMRESLVYPFGRFGTIRKDWTAATKSGAEGGNGTAQKLWDWSEEQVREFL